MSAANVVFARDLELTSTRATVRVAHAPLTTKVSLAVLLAAGDGVTFGHPDRLVFGTEWDASATYRIVGFDGEGALDLELVETRGVGR